jgi:hypothetical protein
MHNYNRKLFILMGCITGCLLMMQLLSSCGTDNTTVNPSGSTTKIVVVNTCPDVGPLGLFVNTYQLGNNTGTLAQRTFFRYSTPPVYYSIGTGALTLQLRTDHNLQYTTDTITTLANKSYSLFFTGLAAVDSVSTLLINDDLTLPPLGRGRMRFINLSPRAPALDVYVNGAIGFSKTAFKKVAPYIELPAGVYDFKLTVSGGATSQIADLPLVTIQDGKVYTLYSKGLIGRTDTAAISLNVITNK